MKQKWRYRFDQAIHFGLACFGVTFFVAIFNQDLPKIDQAAGFGLMALVVSTVFWYLFGPSRKDPNA